MGTQVFFTFTSGWLFQGKVEYLSGSRISEIICDYSRNVLEECNYSWCSYQMFCRHKISHRAKDFHGLDAAFGKNKLAVKHSFLTKVLIHDYLMYSSLRLPAVLGIDLLTGTTKLRKIN